MAQKDKVGVAIRLEHGIRKAYQLVMGDVTRACETVVVVSSLLS